MTKNPAEIAGTRYKNEKLMSRVQKTDGTSRCFAQIENIKRQSLISGLDKLTEGEMKNFVRHGLKDELISLLTMFKAFPSFT